LLGRPKDDSDVRASQRAAMRAEPIATILGHQQPEGFWAKPGPGYSPKYLATVWQLTFLDQLGADPDDRHVRAACEYVLGHAQAENGGFGASGSKDDTAPPPPSRAIHCLTGNLLRALLGFGWLEDQRVQRAIEWQARIATGEGCVRYYASATSGPGYRCAANDKLPCAWGATKVLLAFARIPRERRTSVVEHAIQRGVELLLSADPATAAYPMGYGNTKPNGSWFKLGFPSGYVTDVLQVLEALCELGLGGDPRLERAIAWLLSKQDAQGRWKNEYAYTGKLWTDIEPQGRPSKWVTLRACRVLELVDAQGGL
jgi:prenyltransferase/squalene oxidase-like repeat protein